MGGVTAACGFQIIVWWMTQDRTDKSTLVLVITWCHRAASQCLSQCWLRYASLYGVTRPQLVNAFRSEQIVVVFSSIVTFGYIQVTPIKTSWHGNDLWSFVRGMSAEDSRPTKDHWYLLWSLRNLFTKQSSCRCNETFKISCDVTLMCGNHSGYGIS